ncbi:chemotaxis protein CheC [Isachenkonia alkalipeptolytica]|uniref:Chemotaxis protein CheC n=2 Tax=Isachenkonia alkalipeptolytica TaxID=2565777 RepID=A0AA43XJT2_9CLOT|nr:chemotaxis protein CheC [Isachenkonia alkalipeptolytica]
MSIESLNQQHIDVLKEIGNIGAGNAATALAGMLGKKIDMDVPKVKILDIQEVAEVLGGEENIVAGIYFNVHGDIQGNIMFLLDLDSSKLLTNMLMGKSSENGELDEMDRSALREVGNILSGAYIASLVSLTNFNIHHSVPSLAVDMAGAVMSVPAIQFSHISDKVLFIETELKEGKDLVEARFFLIPDEPSFEKILNSLGVY